ncbi:OCIA domain-containing protein 1 [Cloeon dipterum]|uniref:OCIA domain-containing protein 1 n=1 Tax=Cloeon dipterum TaxID=197152 RepID=UPI0032203BD7
MDPYNSQQSVAAQQPVNPFDGRSGPYKFTADEVRVFKECNRESFYQRSLPIGTFLGLGAFYATKAGFLKPSPRWGVAPKVGLAVIAGYFLGKISYQKQCMEKIMKLPNSPLADALRKKKNQLGDSFSFDSGLSLGAGPTTGLVADSFQVYSDHGPRNSTELDFTKPLTSIDTSQKPFDDGYLMEDPLPAATKTTTYEDLRAQNREDFEKKRSSSNRGLMLQPDLPAASRGPPPPAPGEQTNQYGDTWIRST